MEKIIQIFLVVTIGFLILLIPLFLYYSYQDSLKEGFELKKEDWACTAYKSNTPIMVQTGKAMLPVGGGSKCVQWTRLGGQ